MKKIKKFYSYQELLDSITIENVNLPRFPHDVQISSQWFTSLIGFKNLEIAVYTLNELFTDSLINDIVNALMSIVYNRHSQDFISWIESNGNDQDDLENAIIQALSKLINVIDLTLPRYVPMLQRNEFYSVDPVAPIASTTTGRTRFNDTPQYEGEFNDEDHATNVSKSTTETKVDSASIVARLDEMFKNYRSIILEWSNEFNSLFLKEEQI